MLAPAGLLAEAVARNRTEDVAFSVINFESESMSRLAAIKCAAATDRVCAPVRLPEYNQL